MLPASVKEWRQTVRIGGYIHLYRHGMPHERGLTNDGVENANAQPRNCRGVCGNPFDVRVASGKFLPSHRPCSPFIREIGSHCFMQAVEHDCPQNAMRGRDF